MKHTASAKKSSSPKGSLNRPRKAVLPGRQFAVCVDNDGYEASLERNKIYVVVPDKEAEKDGDLRVIDESGEDYLFSADRFVAIDVPAAVKGDAAKFWTTCRTASKHEFGSICLHKMTSVWMSDQGGSIQSPSELPAWRDGVCRLVRRSIPARARRTRYLDDRTRPATPRVAGPHPER
jgi:hypothetical protein